MLRSRSIALSALALLVTAALAPDVRARCAPAGSQIVVIPEGAMVSAGGAFLVGLQRASRARLRELPAALALTAGDERVELRLERIAPGLARAFPARSVAGEWQLAGEGVAPGASVVFGRIEVPRLARAPRVGSLTSVRTSAPSRRRRAQHSVSLRLSTPLDPSFVALALVRGSRGSWMPVRGGEAQYELYPRVGRCDILPPGFSPLSPGTDARLIALDVHARAVEVPVRVH